MTIARAKRRTKYPARFILAASANPCPCGYLHDPKRNCSCTPREIEKYSKRVSGPILDRIDLHIDVPVVDIEELAHFEPLKKKQITSDEIRDGVIKARKIQQNRFSEEKIYTNAEMKNKHITKYCKISKPVKDLLVQAGKKFNLSARSYYKMIKVARTIADLEGATEISIEHMAEALQYRLRAKV